jgi:hypothetical protein
MKKKIKVYIASPYTKGDVALNVRKSFEVYTELLKYDFLPFAPLTSHFIHMIFPQTYETWLEIDFDWLLVCDCVLRLLGESNGADQECELAKENDILVFYTLEELIKYYGVKND